MKIDWYQNLYTYWHVWFKYVQSKWTTLFLNPTVKFMVQGCPIHEINISYLLWLTSNGNKVVQFWKLLLQSAISLNHILSLKLVWKYINHYRVPAPAFISLTFKKNSYHYEQLPVSIVLSESCCCRLDACLTYYIYRYSQIMYMYYM